MVTTVMTSLQPNGTYYWWREKKGRVMSDPAWPTHEHRNKTVRGRGAVFFISQRTGKKGPGNLGDLEETVLNQLAICQPKSPRASQSSWPVSIWGGYSVISRYLTGARQSKFWAPWKAINIPEQKCYPQERRLPGAPGHWARCRFVPVTSGSHSQIGYQQVRGAVTGAGNFIDGIGFTNYPQNTLKWNIKFPIP